MLKLCAFFGLIEKNYIYSDMLRTCVRRVGSFAASKRGDFYQRPPTIGNQYDEDPFLRECLANAIPARDALRDVEADLRQFGHQVATNVLAWHYEAERHPPYLEHFDAWGNRVDTLHTCNAWKQMKHVSAVEGLVAIAYERQLDVYSRIYQMAKLFLFAPSSGMYSCPLAMTDGAASVLRNVATAVVSQDFDSAEAFARLTTRDPQRFWTSGQWMTERQGGSDVCKQELKFRRSCVSLLISSVIVLRKSDRNGDNRSTRARQHLQAQRLQMVLVSHRLGHDAHTRSHSR